MTQDERWFKQCIDKQINGNNLNRLRRSRLLDYLEKGICECARKENQRHP